MYELLRDYLRSGEVRWGESLREATLAARLGVSRTPVREALARLASEGLVEAHGRSFTVPALTEDDLQDIYELRVLLEKEALRQAATRADAAEGVKAIKRTLEQAQAAYTGGNAEGFITANRAFRAAWLSLVRNRRLVRAVELYADHVRALQFLTLGDAQRQKAVLRGMKDILRAIEKHDPAEAGAAMDRYLALSRGAMLQAAGVMNGATKVA
ncbi:MAG TPA: GntR family transcriptional regulator [Burkholderiales bacterium]|nr:GntR family transcriptional regulator [Burkholderiales bacterium]